MHGYVQHVPFLYVLESFCKKSVRLALAYPIEYSSSLNAASHNYRNVQSSCILGDESTVTPEKVTEVGHVVSYYGPI